jgi:hypothetical protein
LKSALAAPTFPVALPTLTDRLDRFELKFLLTAPQRERLTPQLLPQLRADENAGAGASYPIVSLYYDNADRDCYWERERGLGSRRKLRIRTYGSRDGAVSAVTFLEVKQKHEGRGVKRRVPLPLREALRAAAAEPVSTAVSEAEQRVLAEVRELVRTRGFRPCCCLRYTRQAYADRDLQSDLRITFDTDIACRFDRLEPTPDDRDFDRLLVTGGACVMELKGTGAIPYWLTRLLGEAGCVLRSHSKYSHALEAGGILRRTTL